MSTIINQEVRDKYYSTYFNRFQAKNIDLSPYYKQKFSATFPMDKESKILEIGTGMGYFMATLKKFGYAKLRGVDVSAEMVQLAKAHSGVEIENCSDVIEYLNRFPETFDRIYMLDVIEHIEKDKVIGLLMSIHKALRKDGMFVLTTENMASPIGRIQHYLDFTHEYNYCEVSLSQVLAVADFKNVRIWEMKDSIPLHLKYFFYWLCRRLWYRFLKFLYTIERPNGVIPTIYGKELIASGTKN